jgi:Carboxypeptidase regulatory-like domain
MTTHVHLGLVKAILITIMLLVSLRAFPQQQVSRLEGIVVKAAGDEPLSGAVLLLTREGGPVSDSKYKTTTANDGHFVLKDLPQARYRLTATMPGFVDQEYGQKQPNRPGTILDLTTAQTLRDVTIRMTAFGAISGRVYDQYGQPREGTVIRAFNRRFQRDGRPVLSEVAEVLTNDLGEYRMYRLAPGTYFLFAMALSRNRRAMGEKIIDQSEERPDVFSSVFYPNGDDDSQATPLRVNAGSELRGIDFSLLRTKAVRVKGRVVATGTDRPIGDATLVMLPKFLQGPSPNVSTQLLSTTTDDEGLFEFRDVAPGTYSLDARRTEPGFRFMFSQREIRIGLRDISDLQITLQPNPGISGRLTSEDGEPVPHDRTVLLFNSFDGRGDSVSAGTGVLADGTFSLLNVSPGVLRLELTGFPDNFFIRSARAGGQDVLQSGVDLTENSTDSLEVIVSSHGGTVEGVVNNEGNSKPTLGARVVLLPVPGNRPELVKTAVTDQYGRFAISGLVPGNYKIFAWEDLEPNIYFDPSFMEQYEPQGLPLRVDQDSRITLNVKSLPIR